MTKGHFKEEKNLNPEYYHHFFRFYPVDEQYMFLFFFSSYCLYFFFSSYFVPTLPAVIDSVAVLLLFYICLDVIEIHIPNSTIARYEEYPSFIYHPHEKQKLLSLVSSCIFLTTTVIPYRKYL